MANLLDTLEVWIASHQALVVSIGLPIITLMVTAIFGHYHNKANLNSQRQQRALQKEVKLAEFRQNWINQLRDSLAEYIALCMPDGKETDWEKLILVGSKVRLLMNPNDKEYQKLMEAMAYYLDIASGKVTENKNQRDINLAHISQGILKREWDRLKEDLEKIEVAEGK